MYLRGLIEDIEGRRTQAIDARGGRVNLTITASIGIAVYPQNGATADSLVAHADQAMYRAKRDKSGYSFIP